MKMAEQLPDTKPRSSIGTRWNGRVVRTSIAQSVNILFEHWQMVHHH
jgi:hypothetical protein